MNESSLCWPQRLESGLERPGSPACWYPAGKSFLLKKCNRLSSAGGETAAVGKVVPLEVILSFTFIHWSLLSNLTADYLIKQRKTYSCFCILQTASPLCYLSLWGTVQQCSLYSGHPLRTTETHFLNVIWTARGTASSLIFQRNFYMREYIVCVF